MASSRETTGQNGIQRQGFIRENQVEGWTPENKKRRKVLEAENITRSHLNRETQQHPIPKTNIAAFVGFIA
jgi:hypothetical protein